MPAPEITDSPWGEYWICEAVIEVAIQIQHLSNLIEHYFEKKEPHNDHKGQS